MTPESAPAGKARYIMIGGFLGAGKTTSVGRLAEHLARRGLRVGLITNDQGSELVDTAMLRSRGFATEEIAGGCFCCRFDSLLDAARNLTARTRPEVFIAEPVGSCTDLVATVTYPLRRIYGDDFHIAPLSVLVDPIRAARVLGLEEGARFSEKVLYIYRKQLEEADIIVINKCDAVEARRLDSLRSALAREFPRAEILTASARTRAGLETWFQRIATGEQQMRASIPLDYAVYAEGEALLGWLNATVHLSSAVEFDGNRFIRGLANAVHARLNAAGAQVAHLKMTLSPERSFNALAISNLVRSDFVPELAQELPDPIAAGDLIVNLRAEAPPALLREAVTRALEETKGALGVDVTVAHLEAFEPGKPQPTHRVTL